MEGEFAGVGRREVERCKRCIVDTSWCRGIESTEDSRKRQTTVWFSREESRL